MKRLLAVLLGLVVVLSVGCSGGQTSNKNNPPNNSNSSSGGKEPANPNAPVEGGTLNLSMFSAPKGVFNPILYEDQYDANVIDLVFRGLLRFNEKLEFICDMCDTYDVSSDNKTVTFHLRKDIKWHDGQPFTTEDVAFTFRSILHPEYTGVRTWDFYDLSGVAAMLDERDELATQVEDKKITDKEASDKKMAAWNAWLEGPGKQAINVIDEYTVSFSTDEPYAPFLSSLSYSIIPAHLYKDTPIAQMENAPAVKKPIGTGPFKFVEYVTDQYVKLERNPDFYLGKPYIQTIIYKLANQDVAIGQLKAGEVDYIDIKPADVELIQGDSNILLVQQEDFGYQYMGFNHDVKPLDDKRVRQAFMYAINREAMVQQIMKGYGTVMNSHMPPALWSYDASKLNPYKYDPKKAAQLLADAGWTEKNADGYLVKDGKVLEFTLKYPSGNKVREASAPLIQANMKEVGVKINLQMMEFATLATTVFDERNMDLWLMGWSLSADPDPGAIFLPTNKWGSVTHWTNARNEELIEAGVRVLKVSERKPIYVEWAGILNDELPYAFLYSQNVLNAVRQDKIKGLKPDIRGTLWNIWELWIPKDKQG